MKLRILIVIGVVAASAACTPKDACGGASCTAEQRCTPSLVCVTDLPPVLTLESPLEGMSITESRVELKGAARDDAAGLRVELSLNGAAFINVVASADGLFASPLMLPSMDGAAGNLTVRATDSKGRVVKIERGFKVDNVSPVCAITSPADGALITGTALAVTLSASDGSLSLVNPQLSVDGATTFATPAGSAGNYTFGEDVTGTNGTTRQLVFRVSDSSGHSCEAKRTVTIDNVKPSVGFASPDAGSVLGQAFFAAGGVLAGTASDGARMLKSVTVDFANAGVRAATVQGNQWTLSIAGPAGDNFKPETATVVATDLADNTASATIEVTVDTVPPTVGFSSPDAGTVLGAAFFAAGGVLSGTVSDGTAMLKSVTVSFADAGVRTATVLGNQWTISVSAPAGDDFTAESARVVATDFADNVASATLAVTVDPVLPTVSFSSPDAGTLLGPVFFAAGGLLSGTVSDGPGMLKSVTVSFADAGVRAATVQGNQWTLWVTAPVGDDFKSELATVVATDLGDNSASASLAVTVDVVAPVLAITFPSANARLNVSNFPSGNAVPMAWTLTDGDPQLSIGSTISGGALQKPPQLLTSPTDNPKIYQPTLVASDRAGNTSNASVTFSVDRVAPVVTNTAPANNTRMYVGAATANFSEPMTGGDGLTLAPSAGAGTWTTSQQWTSAQLTKDTVYIASTGTPTDLHGNPVVASTGFRFHTETWMPMSGDKLAVGYRLFVAAVADQEGSINLVASTPSRREFLHLDTSDGSLRVLASPDSNSRLLVSHQTVQADLSSRRVVGMTHSLLTSPFGNEVIYEISAPPAIPSLFTTTADAFIPTAAFAGEGTGLDSVGFIRGGNYERAGRASIAISESVISAISVTPKRWEIADFTGTSIKSQTFGCYPSILGGAPPICEMRPAKFVSGGAPTAPFSLAASSDCSVQQLNDANPSTTTFFNWQPECGTFKRPACFADTTTPGFPREIVADPNNEGTFYSVEGNNPYQVRKLVLAAGCTGAWANYRAPLSLPSRPKLVVIRGTPGLIYDDTVDNLIFVVP